MKYFAFFSYAILALAAVICSIIIVCRKRNPLPARRAYCSTFLPLAPLALGALAGTASIGNHAENGLFPAIYTLMILMSLYAVYIAAWHIDFDESGFILYIFGFFRRQYSYRDVTKIRYIYSSHNSREKAGYKLRVCGHGIVLNYTAPNNRAFAAALLTNNPNLKKQLHRK